MPENLTCLFDFDNVNITTKKHETAGMISGQNSQSAWEYAIRQTDVQHVFFVLHVNNNNSPTNFTCIIILVTVIINGTERPTQCRCAVSKSLTHSLTPCIITTYITSVLSIHVRHLVDQHPSHNSHNHSFNINIISSMYPVSSVTSMLSLTRVHCTCIQSINDEQTRVYSLMWCNL